MGTNYDKWFKTRYLGWRIYKAETYAEAVLRPVLTRDRVHLSEDQTRIFPDVGVDRGAHQKDRDVHPLPRRRPYRSVFGPERHTSVDAYQAQLTYDALTGFGDVIRGHYMGWYSDLLGNWIAHEELALIRDDEACSTLRTTEADDDYYWGRRAAKLLEITVTIPDRVTTAELRIED